MSEKLLYGAIRQFRHNNSDNFVMGYDVEETEKVVKSLKKDRELLEDLVLEFEQTPFYLLPEYNNIKKKIEIINKHLEQKDE